MTDPSTEEVFEYLDALRQSGVTNMFGAAPYVEKEFGLGRNAARKLVVAWMDTFNEHAADYRAAEAESRGLLK